MRQVTLALGLALGAATADQLEYTAYSFTDNASNSVATTSFNLAKTLWQRTMLLLDIELDQITVPPLDGETGASRPARRVNQEFKKARGQFIFGVEQGLGDNTRFAANYYHSDEVDYLSQAVIAAVTQELFQKNTTMHLRAQYTRDSVGEIRPDGSIINRGKEVHQAAVSLTQLLSPTLFIKLGADALRLTGFLSDPYRQLRRGGPSSPLERENHPDERWRQSVCGDLNWYLTDFEMSVLTQFRYYWDDWNVTSQTSQLKFNKYINANMVLSPEYRYYTQEEADFGDYAAGGDFFSGDYKLRAFESHNAGLGFTWFLRGMAAKHPQLDFLGGVVFGLTYFRYWNTLDFSSNVFEGKLRFEF